MTKRRRMDGWPVDAPRVPPRQWEGFNASVEVFEVPHGWDVSIGVRVWDRVAFLSDYPESDNDKAKAHGVAIMAWMALTDRLMSGGFFDPEEGLGVLRREQEARRRRGDNPDEQK